MFNEKVISFGTTKIKIMKEIEKEKTLQIINPSKVKIEIGKKRKLWLLCTVSFAGQFYLP